MRYIDPVLFVGIVSFVTGGLVAIFSIDTFGGENGRGADSFHIGGTEPEYRACQVDVYVEYFDPDILNALSTWVIACRAEVDRTRALPK